MIYRTASGEQRAQQAVRFDWDASGNPLYKGVHPVLDADTSAGGWLVWKYTWDVSGNMTLQQGPLSGAWDNRASLGW